MSFILDALKKSESERARQAGPGLMEVRIAPPRNRLPLWAMLVGALLLLNIVVLGAVLIYRGSAVPPPAALAASPAAVATVAAPGAAAVSPVITAAPAATAPAPIAALPAEPLLESRAAPPLNPADYAPALPAGSSALPLREPAEENLPSRDDLVAAGQQIPELRLSLHVFDPVPANRYVLVNSSRLREGDAMPDGMRLERITEGGVVMSWRGTRFRLQRGD